MSAADSSPKADCKALRPMRCVLAVPGHRWRMLESASASAADAVFIDLEDAVPPGEKKTALDSAIRALEELDWGHRHVSVRVNSTAEGVIESEIAALAANAPRLDSILVPKVESTAVLDQVETILDARRPAHSPLAIDALIETARGLVHVDAIAAAGGRLAALHFGVGDFSASIGARNVEVGGTPAGYALTRKGDSGEYATTSLDLWAYPMMRVLVAARAFNLRVIDGPCGAFRDLVLTRSFAIKAAAMGFDGKQVIHPDQIAVTVAAFTPSDDEVRVAEATIEAMKKAEAAGLAAVSVEGRMVDYANLRMAQRVLAMAGRT